MADPVASPLHSTSMESVVRAIAVGWFIVMLSVSEQPLRSVIVTVYVPPDNPVTVAVVPPVKLPGPHKNV